MAIQLSPGINVSEVDLSTIVPSGATSTGAFAGPFVWGPGEEIVTITNENKLAETFGKPTLDNAEYWFSAANFLAYSNNLKVVRAISANDLNASTNTSARIQITNNTDYSENHSNLSAAAAEFAAKYPGTLGNSLSISICPNANAWSQNVTAAANSIVTDGAVSTATNVVVLAADPSSYVSVGDLISVANSNISTNYVEVSNINGLTITTTGNFSANVATGARLFRRWKYYSAFTDGPSTSDFASSKSGSRDEMHVVVVDADGEISGAKNTILEKFAFVSKASDAKTSDGSSNYYRNVLNNRSKYVWHLKHIDNAGTNWGNTASQTVFSEDSNINYYQDFSGGALATTTDGDIMSAYDMFNNSDTTDISLIISGPANQTVAEYLIGIADTRKDCLVFLSPERSDVVDAMGSESTNILTYRQNLTGSSYAVMDSGWKYQYDKYRDTYTWAPLNGDIAGLNARTDLERDPWFSPAGVNRGQIKNVVKLAWNPSKADRDDLYLKGVNPVVTFSGEGTILYGDKTMLSRPSAFDRINVRRLFIVLEKSIARAARSTLFEFNDQFTRAQFVALVEPYLRDVQGRRGITDFRVVCDESNNTGEVIDRNEFVGDIYIKPARSVNFIQLNFVVVRSGVNFQEIVGQF